jgi:hypothetical protein
MPDGVLDVIGLSSPSQILKSVVERIAIVVKREHAIWTWAYERLKNETMNFPDMGLAFFPKRHKTALIPASHRLHPTRKDTAVDIRPRPLARIDGAHTTETRNYIVGKSRNQFPLFFHRAIITYVRQKP